MYRCYLLLIVSMLLSAVISITVVGAETAKSSDRKQIIEKRKKVVDWCKRHGSLIKGMTKGEVLDVCGRPDRKFNYNMERGRLEQWIYNYPRRRGILPLRRSPFEGRYRYLYFRNDILVNFER